MGWIMTPEEFEANTDLLITTMLAQRKGRMKGGIYWSNQIEMAYNSNHIEGSKLTRDQTRAIFETKTIEGRVDVEDVIEANNHFLMFGSMLDTIKTPLSIEKIKKYHEILKTNTIMAREGPLFIAGDWKNRANEVGGMVTTPPDEVDSAMRALCDDLQHSDMSFEDICQFHYRFESIHPFQDGNGRVGRIVMFEQCLQNSIMPFIVLDEEKDVYYRGLREYSSEPGYLVETCRHFQDVYYEKYREYVQPTPCSPRERE